MYEQGQRCALTVLGLEKTATPGPIRRAIMAITKKNPAAAAHFLGTAPFLAPLGALTGGVTGAATSDEGQRGKGFLRGALLGGTVGGLAAGTHGAIRGGLSRIPARVSVHSPMAGKVIEKLNPDRAEQFKRIFGEAAGIAGLTGAGAGLLARKKESSVKTALSPGAAQMLKRMAVGVGTGAGIGWLIAPRPEDRPRTAVLSGLADIPILAASQLPDVVHHLEATRPGFAAAMSKMRGVPSALKHVIMRR